MHQIDRIEEKLDKILAIIDTPKLATEIVRQMRQTEVQFDEVQWLSSLAKVLKERRGAHK